MIGSYKRYNCTLLITDTYYCMNISILIGFCDALGQGSSSKAAVIRRGLSEMVELCRMIAGPNFELETVLQSCGVADIIATSFGGRNRLCAEEYAKRLLDHERQNYHQVLSLGEGEEKGDIVPHNGGMGFPKGGDLSPNRGISTSSLSGELLAANVGKVPSNELKEAVTTEVISNLWNDIEVQLLQGQKLQGLSTCEELMSFMKAKGLDREIVGEKTLKSKYADFLKQKFAMSSSTLLGEKKDNNEDVEMKKVAAVEHRFGLLCRIHDISHHGASPRTLFDW